MTQPWKELTKPDDIDIVAPDGTVRSQVKGYYSGKQFIIDDMSVDVRPGDEIRRLLPNGKEEAFVVKDPQFFRDGPFGSHYQVSISRRGIFEPHVGGNYNIKMSGPTSRVNIASNDSSSNLSVQGDVFGGIRQALVDSVRDDQKRSELTAVRLSKRCLPIKG